jgi:hypothetical protein
MDEDTAVATVLRKFGLSKRTVIIEKRGPKAPLPFAWTKATLAEHGAYLRDVSELRRAYRTYVRIPQSDSWRH